MLEFFVEYFDVTVNIRSNDSSVINTLKWVLHTTTDFESDFTIIILHKENNYIYKVYHGSKLTQVKEKPDNSDIIMYTIGMLERIYEKENNHSVFFHCSAVYCNDRIMMFMNTSGHGKTTTLLYLLNKYNEINYVSDDILAVDIGNNRLYGLPWALHMKEGTYNLFRYPSAKGPFVRDKQLVWLYNVTNNKIQEIHIPSNIIVIKINYDLNYSYKINELLGARKADVLINNCRSINRRTKDSISTINKLNTYSRVFEIYYSNTEETIRNLYTLLNL